MKHKWITALPAIASFASLANAQTNVIPDVYPYVALGYQQITNPSTATTLTIPAGTRVVELCIENQAIRYRDDGTAPNATTGIPVAVGVCFQYSGPLGAIQFIQQASSATIDASYYR